jgi:RNA recognition motif-containing protein
VVEDIKMTNKVFVGNLPWSVRTEELSDFLSDLGFAYRSVKVIEDRDTQRSRGYAFVEFETPEAAAEAIRELTGAICEGRTLFANEAKDTKPRGGEGGGGGSRGIPRESSRSESSHVVSQEQRQRSKSNKPHRGGRTDEDYGW